MLEVMILFAESWQADFSRVDDGSVSVYLTQGNVIGVEIQTDYSIKRGSTPSFLFWQMEEELDIVPISSKNPNADRLLNHLLRFKAIECFVSQLQCIGVSDFYRASSDLILPLFRFRYGKNPYSPGTVFHTDQAAELISIFLIVPAAQIHHPIPMSDKPLFPFFMRANGIYFSSMHCLEAGRLF